MAEPAERRVDYRLDAHRSISTFSPHPDMNLTITVPALALLALTAVTVDAQGRGPQAMTFEASGRASTELNVRGATGGAKVTIEYGQPHAKGREVFGALE